MKVLATIAEGEAVKAAMAPQGHDGHGFERN